MASAPVSLTGAVSQQSTVLRGSEKRTLQVASDDLITSEKKHLEERRPVACCLYAAGHLFNSTLNISIFKPGASMIFTITALSIPVRKLTQEGEPYFRRDSRNVGYYFNLESAKKALTDLPDIMSRSSAEYVVIEAFKEGIFPTTTDGAWFVWSNSSQKFEPCEKPSDLAQTCNFGLG